MHVRSSDHWLFAHGPTKQNLVLVLLRNLPSLRKDLDPLFEGFKNRIASAPPAKFGLHGTFAYPSPSIELTFLHAGTPFWVGRTTFDGKVGAGDRKRNLPNIHGVL